MRMPALRGYSCLFLPVSYDRTVRTSLSTLCVRGGIGGSRINLLTKMKRFSAILAALALVVLMQGGGKGVEPETPNNPVQLRLKGNISAITPSTRVNANGFEAEDKVGVYVSATGALASSGNMLDNTAFTYTGGNLTAPEGKEVYWGTPDVRLSVWAYYPYATNVENLAEYPFAVATDQKDEADYYNSDFITAQAANLAPQAEAVNLTFNHSLSKIAVILKNGTGITSEELASAEKSLSIDGVIVDGAIDLADGTATTGTTEATITPYAFDGLNYAAIVYPQQSEITFRIELGDDVYIYSTEVDYVAGTQYKYTFTIDTRNPQGMTLASTTISDWTDDENPTEATLSDIITFTDPKFKEYLLQEYLYQVEFSRHDNGDPHWVATPIGRIDANNDGEISIAEAEKVEYINTNYFNKLNGLGIRDMSELHFFLNLKILYCHSNELTTLDVSKNTALTDLNCWGNQLTSLDMSKNTDLIELVCYDNQLTSLDVTNNTALTDLNCWGNQLTTLDVSNNTALIYLCCDTNQLTSLDISNNVKLVRLHCHTNQIEELNVQNNIALTYIYCAVNKLTTLDVSKNTALTELYCSQNQLTTLDVSNNIGLKTLECSPMDDAEGNNLLETIYIAEGHEFETLEKPEETVIEEKE